MSVSVEQMHKRFKNVTGVELTTKVVLRLSFVAAGSAFVCAVAAVYFLGSERFDFHQVFAAMLGAFFSWMFWGSFKDQWRDLYAAGKPNAAPTERRFRRPDEEQARRDEANV